MERTAIMERIESDSAANSATTGKYIYGIIRSSQPCRFASKAVGSSSRERERQQRQRDGDRASSPPSADATVHPDPTVYTIHVGDLAAVVSDSPIVEYEQSRRNMLAHTRVLEEVMQQYTILPMRFGMIAPNAGAIQQQLLARRSEEITQLLQRLADRREIGLKVFWQQGVLFEEVVEQHPRIRELRDSLMGRSPTETHYERIRLGELIEKTVVEKREAEAAQILAELRPLAEETKISQVISERMLLNAAFLVENQHASAFGQTVEALDRRLGGRMVFKYIGAAPPYNFVNLILRWDS